MNAFFILLSNASIFIDRFRLDDGTSKRKDDLLVIFSLESDQSATEAKKSFLRRNSMIRTLLVLTTEFKHS